MIKRIPLPALIIMLLGTLSACMPITYPSGEIVTSGQLLEDLYITDDGTRLPLKTWPSTQQETQAVIIALHGFNDYSHFFQKPAEYFAQHQITSYAYDQRGFGGSPNRGFWSGVDTYVNDLALFIHLIKNKHPNKPIFLLGESMGGAVIINAIAKSNNLQIQGIILAAPAIWGRQIMPWYQTALLWSLSHSLPWLTLTGDNLKITASDNLEMLKTLSRDPLVIKETRVDSLYGLVNLMDRALESASSLPTNTLLLYGDKDEIIPKKATSVFLQRLLKSDQQNKTVAFYKEGYHMLLRDIQAPLLWNDILTWMHSFNTPLPSGADNHANDLIMQKTAYE